MDAAVNGLIDALRSRDGTAMLARVVALNGFGLRDTSDGAVILGDPAALRGRVLGGLIDDALLTAAIESTARRSVRFSVTDRDADAAGMVCGGSVRLLLTPVADLPPELGELLEQAQPLALVAASDGSLADIVVTRRAAFGAAEHLDDAIVDHARATLGAGVTSTVEMPGSTDMLISTLVPATRFLVVGSGPMADAIAAQGQLMGWSTEIGEDVSKAIDFVSGGGPADGIAILSHDGEIDVPILAAALDSPIGYIGAMGSRGTQTRRRTALIDAGHTEDQLRRIHGPIGLDVGARSPSETAVAIAAEFLAHRSGRRPGRLTDGSGPING